MSLKNKLELIVFLICIALLNPLVFLGRIQLNNLETLLSNSRPLDEKRIKHRKSALANVRYLAESKLQCLEEFKIQTFLKVPGVSLNLALSIHKQLPSIRKCYHHSISQAAENFQKANDKNYALKSLKHCLNLVKGLGEKKTNLLIQFADYYIQLHQCEFKN